MTPDLIETDPQIAALSKASGHTARDTIHILGNLNCAGWTVQPVRGFVADLARKPEATTPWTGLPPDPTATGWHWLRGRDLETPEVAEWSELCQSWAWSGVSGTDTPAEIAERMVYVGPCDPNAAVEIERLRTVIANAASTVDAILRGRHSGWDQALAKLRDDLGGDAP